jgi:hypothetical protein
VCAILPRVTVATRISGYLSLWWGTAKLKHLIEIGQQIRPSLWLDTVGVGTYETSVGLLSNQTAHFCLRTLPEVREFI